MKDKMSAGQKSSWEDPTKRVEQKKRIRAKKLLKDATSDRIEPPNPLNIEVASPNPLNIEVASRALIDEIKKSDEQGRRRSYREILNILEKAILIKVLSHVNGKQSDAAKFLGILHTTIYEKLKKHNIKFSKRPIED